MIVLYHRNVYKYCNYKINMERNYEENGLGRRVRTAIVGCVLSASMLYNGGCLTYQGVKSGRIPEEQAGKYYLIEGLAYAGIAAAAALAGGSGGGSSSRDSPERVGDTPVSPF
jgi:hypothetical protein